MLNLRGAHYFPSKITFRGNKGLFPVRFRTILSIFLLITINGNGAAQVADQPIVPVIDATMKAHLQTILADGRVKGNRPDVFAKIGDSITESESFLSGFACHVEDLGAYTGLAATIAYFSKDTFPASYKTVSCGVANSFSRRSISAIIGWSTDDALTPFDPSRIECPVPYQTPLRCELHLIKPGIALIMYGTNDLETHNDPDAFRRNLTEIVKQTISAGTIPVLSTIPPRLDIIQRNARVETYNRIIIDVAHANEIPVMNYWKALTAPGMANEGISEDGIHPNVYGSCQPDCKSTILTPQALHYGYNQRNLIALQTLTRLKAVVIDNGPANTTT
jgi:hypothetical protein